MFEISASGYIEPSDDALLWYLRRLAADRDVRVGELVTPSRRSFDVGRLNISCLDWGNAGRPTILFMHGGRLNAHTWDLVCLALRSEYHCLAMDLPGHGESGWATDGDYSLDRCAGNLAGFVDAAIEGRFVLVGMSLGGMQAMAFACRHASRLNGLVMLDAAPVINESESKNMADQACFEDFATFEEFFENATRGRKVRDPERLRFTLSLNVRRTAEGRWAWKFDTEARARQDTKALLASYRKLAECASMVTCPTLILRGEKSTIVLPEHAEMFAASLPNARLAEVPGAGHILHSDNPNAVIAYLREFLRSLTGAEI